MNYKKRKILEDAGLIYPAVVTNADRIRAMTDEELKEWFCQQRECDDWHCPYCNNNVFGAKRCGLRGWLKSPVEVDNGT